MNRRPKILTVALACLVIPVPAAADGVVAESIFDDALVAAGEMRRLRSLLISRGGELLVEEYFNGMTPNRTANVKSVSKSVMSALIGIAIDQGHLDGLDQPISDFYGDRLQADPARGKITIGNLLSMQAGLETTSFYNYGAWVLSDDWVEFALNRPFRAQPGTRMLYSTGNTHLLSDILTRATGRSTLSFAQETLGRPLGIRVQPWTQAPDGVYFGGNNMEFTPRQMLAIGELYMNGGRANGRQVIPEDWIDTSLTPVVRSSRDTERQYGYGWWMRDMAGLPTVYAWGYGGQFILLVRELDLVVVTTSSSEPGDSRRRHTRDLYRLLEFEIVQPAATSAGSGELPAG
jgi:CubicO group peptidase (beta-lactamase class C family)